MLVKNHHRIFFSFLLCFALVVSSFAQQKKAVYVSYNEAQTVLEAFSQSLPAELNTQDPKQRPTVWTEWVKKSDQDIRARLAQGDEDSLVNLLLFGTTFTKQARVTPRQIEEINKQTGSPALAGERINEIMLGRLNDFISVLSKPSKVERISFAQEFLSARNSFRLNTPEGQQQAKELLVRALARVLQESESYTRIIQQARLLSDTSAAFAERSKLYRNRGLSSDTSLRPNFAIEEALKGLQAKGLIKAGVRRVAIVGPGLDFTDKQDGYDFYPQQTIQPFAVIDSLLRLGLAKSTDLQITTLDLSPKVNDHIVRARASGLRGQPYVLQLPFDVQEEWKPEFVKYWEKFGDQIGSAAKPVSIPANLTDLKLRAVNVRSIFASKLTPFDVNIVLQKLELAETEKFDLIIGTNIFVYYDEFQQGLAMLNMEKMLRGGGILLSNNALIELPAGKIKSVGHTTTVYSNKPDDGDIIVWYQRQAN